MQWVALVCRRAPSALVLLLLPVLLPAGPAALLSAGHQAAAEHGACGAAPGRVQEKDRQRAKKAKSEQKHKLSFDDDFEEEEEEEEAGEGAGEAAAASAEPAAVAAAEQQGDAEAEPSGSGGAAAAAANGVGTSSGTANGNSNGGGARARPRFATLGKDPSVRTDFLPDKDREREEGEPQGGLIDVGRAGKAGTTLRHVWTLARHVCLATHTSPLAASRPLSSPLLPHPNPPPPHFHPFHSQWSCVRS